MPPQHREQNREDWTPFTNQVQFELADLVYRRAELSAPSTDTLLMLWANSMAGLDASAPFKSHNDLHSTIDKSALGDVPWECLMTRIPEDVNVSDPSWMRKSYEVWYCNPDAVVSAMLSNPDFEGQFDLRPYVDLNSDRTRRWNNVMSGNLAWRNSVSTVLSDTFLMYFDCTQLRTRSLLWIQVWRGQCIVPLFLGVTKLPFRWRLDKLSTILYTYRSVTLTMLSGVHIGML